MTDVPLTDPAETLRRQVHPNHWDPVNGVLRTAFTPNKSQEMRLSTHRERVAADEAFRRHTEDNDLDSAGTWPLVVADAIAEGLACVDDTAAEDVPEDHASICFDAVGGGAVKQAARKLTARANEQGPLYRP